MAVGRASRSRIVGALAAAVALEFLQATGAAFAHGAAKWIEDGGYTDGNGIRCCGPQDCHVIMTDDVASEPGGWYVKSSHEHIGDGDERVHVSVDDHYWICRRQSLYSKPVPEVRCLFVPRRPMM